MTVIWYCDGCDTILPLGLWDKIPTFKGTLKDNLVQLLCPKCEENLYCIMTKREELRM
jgi:hypothetical protein